MALGFTKPAEDDPEAVERAAAAEKIDNWDAEVLTALMGTPQGRYLIERYLDFCCEGQELYLDDGDALGMAKRDGMAKAGRWWRIKLEQHCPDRLLQMIRERRGRMGRQEAAIKAREAAREVPEPSELSPIEAMADEQRREADEEAARAAKAGKGGKKKGDR